METSNKQTAIEWLIEKTTESGHLWLTDKPYSMDELSLIIEKAKEIEKQQMADAFYAPANEAESNNFDEYYTQKYKDEN